MAKRRPDSYGLAERIAHLENLFLLISLRTHLVTFLIGDKKMIATEVERTFIDGAGLLRLAGPVGETEVLKGIGVLTDRPEIIGPHKEHTEENLVKGVEVEAENAMAGRGPADTRLCE